MDNDFIVEVIFVEDIGKFLDFLIVELFVCLLGLLGECVGGWMFGILVCGFKEDFIGILLNGWEFIGIGDNCGVEYDLYFVEIMIGVIIYKIFDVLFIV